MADTNQEFDIVVWFRCVRQGEMEKDFIDYKIIAPNVQEAVNEVADKFKNLSAIPFQYLHNGQKHSPNSFNRQIFQ